MEWNTVVGHLGAKVLVPPPDQIENSENGMNRIGQPGPGSGSTSLHCLEISTSEGHVIPLTSPARLQLELPPSEWQLLLPIYFNLHLFSLHNFLNKHRHRGINPST
jgi:hypothetical protein